jgi:hypothetical protein
MWRGMDDDCFCLIQARAARDRGNSPSQRAKQVPVFGAMGGTRRMWRVSRQLHETELATSRGVDGLHAPRLAPRAPQPEPPLSAPRYPRPAPSVPFANRRRTGLGVVSAVANRLTG